MRLLDHPDRCAGVMLTTKIATLKLLGGRCEFLALFAATKFELKRHDLFSLVVDMVTFLLATMPLMIRRIMSTLLLAGLITMESLALALRKAGTNGWMIRSWRSRFGK